MSKYEDGGHYELEVADHAFGETKNGHPKIDFDCKVIRKIIGYGTGNETIAPAESSAYNVNLSLVFATEKQREFNLKKLRFAGWNGTSFDDFDMIGDKFIGVNTHAQGTGANASKVYDNFDLALPPLEHEKLESKPGMKKKLNALLSKELKANQPAAKTVYTEAPKKPDAPPADEPKQGDDETPF